MRKPIACFVVLAAVAMTAPLAAHHGGGASFDLKKQVTLKGTVSQVKWQKPHVLTLATQGYNRNTLKFGQPITAIVNPAANGEPLNGEHPAFVRAVCVPADGNDPAHKCNPNGFLRLLLDPEPVEFVQTQGRLLQLFQWERTLREFWTDGAVWREPLQPRTCVVRAHRRRVGTLHVHGA